MNSLPDDSFFRHMCVNAGVALIATDANLRIQFWNMAAGRIFGGSAESMLGQPIMSIVPSERRILAERLFERTLHKEEVAEFEFPHRSPTGEPMYLAVTVSPIVDDTANCTGISVYVRDVTRRMELEREMADARKMAALGALAGGIAHHFNNQVGGIITSFELARRSNNPERWRRALDAAGSSLSRANKLTQSLLAFAEGDHTDTEFRNLTETIREFLDAMQPRLDAQGIALTTQLEQVDALVPVKRITTILDRVIANACEAMPQGGSLHVELARSEPDVMLKITDTGVGIAPEHLERVFEPFFTTKAGDDLSVSEHHGLGLAVVHGLLKDLGGNATLCSEPDKGTTVAIRLPLKRAAQFDPVH